MTLVVASIVEENLGRISASATAAFAQGADAVEVRLDAIAHLELEDLAKIKREVQGDAIATLRSREEGGGSGLPPAKRAALLREAVRLGFRGVDLELASDRELLCELREQRTRTLIIASVHFPRPVGRDEVEKALDEACNLGDIGKVAMTCEHAGHALMLAQIGMDRARRSPGRFALIGMGPQGQLTRACAREMGSALAYACLPGKPAAAGQLDVSTQRSLLGNDSCVLGLVGHPVSHSVSKPMHEAAMRVLGINGVYLPLDFPEGTFDRVALDMLRRLGFKGVNVTIPHKGTAFRLCSRKSAAAIATEAVNTIKFTGPEIEGENTDVFGFSQMIEGKVRISSGTSALLLGAGGAARAVAHVLRGKGADLVVVDIDEERAHALARMFGGRALKPEELWNSREVFELVVNCTPVGMKGIPGNPFKRSPFKRGGVFIDIIFNPPETEAMRMARQAGARAYGGLEMLVQQGAQSFRFWMGREPDVDAMMRAAQEALR